MIERLQKLLSVKSITTLLLTVVFAYLSAVGIIAADQFMTVYTVIIAFYYGTQTNKTGGA